MAIAIEEAMNKAGKSNYTVTFDSIKNKFSINSDLSCGDHIFSLEFYGGSEKHVDRTRAIYPPRSIGRVLGFPRKNFLCSDNLVCLNAGSDIVIGNHETQFKKEFSVGDSFYVEECQTVFTVTEILSHCEMKVDTIAPCDAFDVCVLLGTHKAPNKFDLSSPCFVILEIMELENIRSNSTPIDRAFAVVPMIFPHNTKNFVISPSGGVPPYIKYFNPPLPRLDRLTVRFRDIDGNLIDFNGIENFLEFRIQSMNNLGYYNSGSVEPV